MPIDSRCMPSSTLRDSIPNEYQLDQELIISNGVNYALENHPKVCEWHNFPEEQETTPSYKKA